MPPRRRAVLAELESAQALHAAGDARAAFQRLERAHILGQPWTGLHVRTHAAMLRWAWRERDARECGGQLLRLVAAAVFSRVWIPIGNTGGANVRATLPMPIPADLAAQLEAIVAQERAARD